MIDTDGFAELTARRPMLYHRAWNSDEAKVASILEHGLESTYSGYSGFWASRPGRAFLKASPDVPEPKYPHDGPLDGGSWSLFAVETAQLEQRRIDPDEDDLGADPQATRETIMANQTLSYRGVVPPSALRLVASGYGTESRVPTEEP